MKLTTCQADLSHALRTIASAVGVRSSHPILDCCLITATGSTMTITGYNLDLGISITTPAVINAAGAVALPYRLLAGLVSRCEPDAPLTLEDGVLTAPSGSYSLAALSAADYPAMPAVDASQAPLALGDAVKACLLAVSTDASKAVLQGVNLAAGAMAATDGHRLVRCSVELPDGINLILPAATMRLLQDRPCTIAHKAGQAVIDAGDGVTIYSRTLDGTYPDVAKLIPDAFKHTITINRHRLQRALERVALIAEAHNNVVKLELRGDDLLITAEADANNGKELLQVEATGKGTWAFNVHYLLDGLKALKPAEAITLSANAPTTPVVLTADTLPGYTYLIMPVQIRG
jgi:DNA polymerase-3 subunit beta